VRLMRLVPGGGGPEPGGARRARLDPGRVRLGSSVGNGGDIKAAQPSRNERRPAALVNDTGLPGRSLYPSIVVNRSVSPNRAHGVDTPVFHLFNCNRKAVSIRSDRREAHCVIVQQICIYDCIDELEGQPVKCHGVTDLSGGQYIPAHPWIVVRRRATAVRRPCSDQTKRPKCDCRRSIGLHWLRKQVDHCWGEEPVPW